MRHAPSYSVVLYALLLGLSVSACDTSAPTQGDSVIQLTTSSGVTALTLTSDRPVTHRSFATRDELKTYLDATETSSALVVNRSVWEATKHALPANTVAVFDEAGMVTVGDTVYVATRDGVYARPASEPSAPLTVDLYYGMDGNAESAEYALVASNSSSPSGLRALTLRNPRVRALADRIADVGGLVDYSEEGAARGTNTCGSPYGWENCAFIPAPGGAQPYVNSQYWSVRFLAFNESSGSLWYKKATAGTQPQVFAAGNWSAVGVNNPYEIGERLGYDTRVYGNGAYNATGDLTAFASCQGNQQMNSPPYTLPFSCYQTTFVDSKRATGREATSTHAVRVNGSTSGTVFVD